MCGIEEFINAIQHIYYYSEKKWREENEKKESKLRDLYYKSLDFFQLYQELELKHILIKSIDTLLIPDFDSSKCVKRIILPPIKYIKNKKERYYKFIPFLSVSFIFKENEPVKNSIYLDLYKDKEKIFSIRYDQRSKGSNHNFFHIQINNKIKGLNKNSPNNKTISWFPSDLPIIPVVHNDNVSALYILFFILGTLYGFENINSFFIGSNIKESIWTIESLEDYYKLVNNN